MYNLPKFSIVTPSLNQGHFIEETICSVLDQKYSNLEYIIIDGGSTDNTLEIIKKYQKHVTYWESKPDKGQSDAINKGLKRANGEIINWLNSDDFYEPDALFKVAEAFQDQSVQVVTGRSRIFYQDTKKERYSRGTDIYEGNLAKTIGWARIDQPETFFRSSVIEKVGYINPSLHYVMDKEWWMRFLLVFGLKGVRKVEDILANFRVHDQSKTCSQAIKFELETDALFFSLATKFEAEAEKELLYTLSENDRMTFLFPADCIMDHNTIIASLQYYLLYKADLFYYRNERTLAGLCLKVINESFLQSEDRSLFRKLTFRNKFYPVKLVKFFRDKWYR